MREWVGNAEWNSTYDHLPSTTVICLLQDRRIEIIEVKLSLDRGLVVRVEDVKRERRLRSMERRGVPINAQQLAVFLNPICRLVTSTELHADTVYSVAVDDEHDLSF